LDGTTYGYGMVMMLVGYANMVRNFWVELVNFATKYAGSYDIAVHLAVLYA
jgi:hypothetical protein